MGCSLNVKYDIACKVVYKDSEGNLTTVTASQNNIEKDGSFNFALPQTSISIEIVISGDATGDGTIDANDVEDLKDVALQTEEAANVTEVGKLAGDINGDGKVTALDLALINAAAQGKIDLNW